MKLPSFIRTLSLVGIWITNFNSLCGTVFPQEGKNAPIEKKAGDSQADLLQDQIRQIKRRLSILGPKHPNWDSTNEKLKELEAKLHKILSPQSGASRDKPAPDSKKKSRNESDPSELVPVDPNRNSKQAPEKRASEKRAAEKRAAEKENSIEPPGANKNQSEASSTKSLGGLTEFPDISPETRWIYQTFAQSETTPYIGYSNAPKIVENSRRLPASWKHRFSQEAMRGIDRIAFVPANNCLYGIEFDHVVGISTLWRWDYSDEARKSLMLRTEGELLDFVFAKQTEDSEVCYILRRENETPTRIELLALDLPKTSILNKSIPGKKLLATLTPDFPSQGGGGHDFYFSEGPEDTLMVLSATGFTSTISQETVRCAQLDPLSMILWNSDQSPNIQSLRSFWVSISSSNNKNERVVLFSDEQIVLHRSQGTESRFLIKGRNGKVLREVFALGLNLDALSIRGVSRIFTDKNLKNSQGNQDLIFLADNQTSICRTQGFGIQTLTSKPIAAYEGRIFQLAKDTEGRLLMLTEDGLLAPTSIENPLSDIPIESILSLADTGLFIDIAKLQPREYFLEYYPSFGSGCHGENSRYFVAFPEGANIKDLGRQGWLFPEGTIFLQMPTTESHRIANHRVKSEPIRILVKSQGQWRHYIYPLEVKPSNEANSATERPNDESILTSGQIQPSVSQKCWDCHSRFFNDGIQSFHDSVLSLTSPSGVLQSEYLRQVRLLTRDHSFVGGVPPVPPTKESTQLLSQVLTIVSRIQALAPNWYGQQLRLPSSSFPLKTVLNEEERLLGIDAFMVTGDERYRNFLVDDGWWDHIQEYISEWLTSITIGEFDKTLDGDLNLDLRPLNHMTTLILTLPEAGGANVHRLFAKAALVLMNARKSSSIYPPSSYSSDTRRYTTSRSFDIAWTDTLLEYYGSVGAPWALQEAKEILDGFAIPKEESAVVQSDRKIILQYCLLCLRAFELTGDAQFLKKSSEIWAFLASLTPTLDAPLEELVLKAHCALRFLFLDVDVVSSQECIRALASFELLVSGSGFSDSQDDSSKEFPIDKLIISKALIESKRIIPELMMFRRTQSDR